MTAPNPRPWYAHKDVGSQSQRRLLLISHHFPPDSAVGARRWEKLTQLATERGWGVDIITREHVVRTPLDQARVDSLPSGVRIYQIPFEPGRLQGMEDSLSQMAKKLKPGNRGAEATPGVTSAGGSGAKASTSAPAASSPPASVDRSDVHWDWSPRGVLRAYWAWRDLQQYSQWCQSVAQLARQISSPATHLAVISSGPPHMMHEAAREASMQTGLPLVMDMRDPWSLNEQLLGWVASPMWYRLSARYERRAVARAALVVANTEHAQRALQAAYPERQRDIITVMNGADDDPIPPSRHGGKFVIAHAGTIYLDRDPRALFRAAARVIQELSLTPDQFGLEFIGTFDPVGGYPIHDVVRQEGLERYASVGPALPYIKAMEFMANATMLVTLSGNNMAAIPAKTFECVRFEAWLLSLSAPGSATALVLQGTSADVVAPNDVDGIAAAIRTRYQQHISGVIPPRIGDDPRFSRRRQADVLFDAIVERNQQVKS